MVIKIKKSAVIFVCLAFIACFGITAVFASNGKTQGKALPILMYHHFLPDKDKLGTYVISPDEFENDIKYLVENGYKTVGTDDVINYANGKGTLPDKPIMITVDDGYYSFYEYIFPILKKYSCKAVLSPIAYYTELYSQNGEVNPVYTHVTYDMLREMSESTLVDIGNHSYNMHKLQGRYGIKKLNSENDMQYLKALSDDIEKAQIILEKSIGKRPNVFTYPFGFHSKTADNFIKENGFKLSLICEEKINYINSPESLYNLGRYNRVHGMNFPSLIDKIEEKMKQ